MNNSNCMHIAYILYIHTYMHTYIRTYIYWELCYIMDTIWSKSYQLTINMHAYKHIPIYIHISWNAKKRFSKYVAHNIGCTDSLRCGKQAAHQEVSCSPRKYRFFLPFIKSYMGKKQISSVSEQYQMTQSCLSLLDVHTYTYNVQK